MQEIFFPLHLFQKIPKYPKHLLLGIWGASEKGENELQEFGGWGGENAKIGTTLSYYISAT